MLRFIHSWVLLKKLLLGGAGSQSPGRVDCCTLVRTAGWKQQPYESVLGPFSNLLLRTSADLPLLPLLHPTFLAAHTQAARAQTDVAPISLQPATPHLHRRPGSSHLAAATPPAPQCKWWRRQAAAAAPASAPASGCCWPWGAPTGPAHAALDLSAVLQQLLAAAGDDADADAAATATAAAGACAAGFRHPTAAPAAA